MNKVIIALATLLLAISTAHAAKLPSVKLRNTEGKTVDTAEINNGGKPVIISFFALWCKPCMKELTAIEEVYEQWQQETGVKLIAISIDDSRSADKVQAETQARGFQWEVLLDTNSDFKRAMNISLIPCTIIIDGQGEVKWQHNAYTDGDEEEIIKVVRQLASGSMDNPAREE